MKNINVNLNSESLELLSSKTNRNCVGVSLRDWLIRTFESADIITTSHPTLFSTHIEVDDDVPLLLEALSIVTKRRPDELVEAWLLEPPDDSLHKKDLLTAEHSANLSQGTLGKVTYVLDLGETLFEETIADAKRKLGGSYPEGDIAAKTVADLFRTLRLLLNMEINHEDHEESRR